MYKVKKQGKNNYAFFEQGLWAIAGGLNCMLKHHQDKTS
jgi:hypothetical protein